MRSHGARVGTITSLPPIEPALPVMGMESDDLDSRTRTPSQRIPPASVEHDINR